jgi:glycerol-1-phosphate dehydrogenase [NAD(P)+]
MSIYTQIAYLPIIFQVGPQKIFEIEDILLSKNLLFNNILLLCGPTFSSSTADSLNLKNINEKIIVNDNSLGEVYDISQLVYKNRYDLILAVGGGKVLDVSKKISQLQRINHISIPTIISNDGLISPITVLKDERGVTESLPGNMPTGVIIDTDIVKKAPAKYLQAASGDILSNMSATNDWLYAASNNRERINDIGLQLSRMAALSLLNFQDIDLHSKHFLKMVIQGQVNSGIAMALSGSSRPCSGSEHLISHALDFLRINKTILHGYQVGLLSLFCLYLQDSLDSIHLNYAKKIGLKMNIDEIYPIGGRDWLEVFEVSRTMRPGRVTILDKFSNDQLLKKKDEFVKFVSGY